MRWLALLGCGLMALGCSTTMVLESEQHPEESRVRFWVTCLNNDESYWADMTMENTSDQDLSIETSCFQMRDATDRPMQFAGWAYFGGGRHTSAKPRPLHARGHMRGIVRFAAMEPVESVKLAVTIDGEEHAFVFKRP